MNKIKIGIVAAEFNYDVTYAMVELAKEHANFLGAEIYSIIKVPGAFDIPLAAKMLLEKKDVSAVVALGAVIEGQTEHDEIVIQHASRKLSDLSLEYKKPVALGISGPGMSRIEAHERVDYAKRAVEAAVKMCRILSQEENEIEIVPAAAKKEKTEVKETKIKTPYKTEPEKTKGTTKKSKRGRKKTKIKTPYKTEPEVVKITKKGEKDRRRLPYGIIMNAFKGKFKDKKFTGNRNDVDNIISTLSGTPLEVKGNTYDAGDLVKKIRTDLLNGKISMPRKLMQALSRAKENV